MAVDEESSGAPLRENGSVEAHAATVPVDTPESPSGPEVEPGRRPKALRAAFTMFIDLTQDRTRSRTLSALAFITIFLFAANVALVGVLRDPRRLKGSSTVTDIEAFSAPPTRALVGDVVGGSEPLQLRVRNFQGFGVEGEQVHVYLTSVFIDDDDHAAIGCESREFDVYWATERVMCEADIDGAEYSSDEFGLVLLDQLRIRAGLSGRYHFVVSQAGLDDAALLNVDELPWAFEFEVALQADAAWVQSLAYEYETVFDEVISVDVDFPARIAVGETFPEARIMVYDRLGNPLPDRRVVISSWITRMAPKVLSGEIDIDSYWAQDVRERRYAELDNAVAWTDSNGLAVFDELRIVGANSPYVDIIVSCDGETLALSGDYTSSLHVQTDVASVELVRSPSDAVEGAVFSPQPAVRVLDANGKPLRGKLCYAWVIMASGMIEPPFWMLDNFQDFHKEAVEFVSEPTGSDGIAEWTGLHINRKGFSGTSILQFSCDGVNSPYTPEFALSSSVAELEVIWAAPEAIRPLQVLDVLPTVRIADADGEPIRGKIVQVLTTRPDVTAEMIYGNFTGTIVRTVVFDTRWKPSSVDGVATFERLLLRSAHNPGHYLLWFYSDEVLSNPVSVWLGERDGEEEEEDDRAHLREAPPASSGPVEKRLRAALGAAPEARPSSLQSNSSAIAACLAMPQSDARDACFTQILTVQPECAYIEFTQQPYGAVLGDSPTPTPELRVVGFDGQPVEGVLVWLDQWDEMQGPARLVREGYADNVWDSMAVSDADGRVSFDHLTFTEGFTMSSYVFSYTYRYDADLSYFFKTCETEPTGVLFVNPVAMVDLLEPEPNLIDTTGSAVGRSVANLTVLDNAPINVRVRVRDADGEPISNVRGSIFVVSEGTVTSVFLSSLFHGREALETILLNAESDSMSGTDGLLTWSSFSFNSGVPGSYKLGVRVGGFMGPMLQVTVLNRVSSIEILQHPVASSTPGEPFVQSPRVRLLDAQGSPVAGYWALCTPLPVFNVDGCTPNCETSVLAVNLPSSAPDAMPTFKSMSVRTGSDGIATWPTMGIVAGARNEEGYKMIYFVTPDRLDAISEPVVVVADSVRLRVVNSGPVVAAVGQPFLPAPSVLVVDAGGNYVNVAFVGIDFASDGNDGSALLADNMAQADHTSFGVVTFNSVYFEVAEMRTYNLTVFAPGDVVVPLRAVLVTDQPVVVRLTSQPPSSLSIGDAFFLTASVAIASGSGLASKTVTAELVTEMSRGELDVVRSSNSTDASGQLLLRTRIVAGEPGEYAVRLLVGGISSTASSPFQLINPVSSIKVVTPAIGLEDDATLVTGRPSDAETLQQPELRVLDKDGNGLAGKAVHVEVFGDVDATVAQEKGTTTDGDGFVTLRGVRFTGGKSGEYRLVYVVDGIAVTDTGSTVIVSNQLEPDVGSGSNWQGIVLGGLFIVMWYWLGLSSWVSRKVLVLSIATAAFLFVLSIDVVKQGVELNVDSFSWALRGTFITITSIVLLSTLALVYMSYGSRLKRIDYINLRDRNHASTVRRLLMSPRRMHSLVTKDFFFAKTEDWRTDRVRAIAARKEPPTSIVERAKRLVLGEPAPPTGFEYWETKRDFVYGQRFLFTFVLSAFVQFLLLLACLVAALYVGFLVDVAAREYLDARAFLARNDATSDSFTAAASAAQRTVASVRELANELDRLNLDSLQVLEDLVDDALSSSELAQESMSTVGDALTEESLNKASSSVTRGLEFIESGTTTDTLKVLKKALVSSGVVAAVTAFLVVFFIWWTLFSAYRARMMELRRGTSSMIDPRATCFNLHRAGAYVGIQVSHAAFEFILIFLLLWAAIMAIFFTPLRSFLWRQTRGLIYAIFSASFLTSIVGKLIYTKYLTAPGFVIRHRLYFGLAEMLLTVTSILSGIATAIGRLVALLIGFVIYYMRLDTALTPHPRESLDPGFTAFSSCLLTDLYFNSPVLVVAASIFAERIVPGPPPPEGDIELNVKSSSALCGQRARARWALAYTLVNNPSLVAMRKRGGTDAKAADATQGPSVSAPDDVDVRVGSSSRSSGSSDE